ncbi:MAG: methyltransferase domain-containing protein [Dehalococcoidia bacterium]|nr:methyltransferase domain-containing protein [Dehalococcoidia bacterium]
MRLSGALCHAGGVTARDRPLEISLAAEVGITAHEAGHLRGVFELPKKLRNARVLDIGTGLSDFPAWLRARGAEAYGLDLTYGRGMDWVINDSIQRAAEDVYKEPEALTFTQQMADRFRASLAPAPAIYVAASALDLPFKNGSFDLVTSSLGIFGTLDHDYEMLQTGFNEALRVLRRGGKLQLSPVFYRAVKPAERACEVNQRRLIAGLKKNNRLQVSDRILGFNAGIGEIVGRLIVTKL